MTSVQGESPQRYRSSDLNEVDLKNTKLVSYLSIKHHFLSTVQRRTNVKHQRNQFIGQLVIQQNILPCPKSQCQRLRALANAEIKQRYQGEEETICADDADGIGSEHITQETDEISYSVSGEVHLPAWGGTLFDILLNSRSLLLSNWTRIVSMKSSGSDGAGARPRTEFNGGVGAAQWLGSLATTPAPLVSTRLHTTPSIQ